MLTQSQASGLPRLKGAIVSIPEVGGPEWTKGSSENNVFEAQGAQAHPLGPGPELIA